MESMIYGKIPVTKYEVTPATFAPSQGRDTTDWRSVVLNDSIPPITEETTESDIPFGYCHCGCGQKTSISRKTEKSRFRQRGQPFRYLPGHHKRKTNHIVVRGDVAYIEINTSAGEFRAVIDSEDIDRVRQYCWGIKEHRGYYYVRSQYGDKSNPGQIWLHRLITNAPEGIFVDHISTNPLDNRKENLRFASQSQNGHNRKSLRNSQFPYKGVTYDSRYKLPFIAQMRIGKTQVFYGRYASAVDAALAYDAAARELHQEFARLNFPMEGEQAA